MLTQKQSAAAGFEHLVYLIEFKYDTKGFDVIIKIICKGLNICLNICIIVNYY